MEWTRATVLHIIDLTLDLTGRQQRESKIIIIPHQNRNNRDTMGDRQRGDDCLGWHALSV